MYHPNPPRRCGGSKQSNSFYAEGGEFSDSGTLWPWAWLLGDGLEDTVFLKIPPRQVQLINPVLTVLFKTFIPMGGPRVPIPKGKRWLYDHLHNAMSVPGIADHVGSQFYSPFNFATETQELSASRRISPQMAKAIAVALDQYGPLPMMFTHKDIPAFRNQEELSVALKHVQDCMAIGFRDKFSQATWKHDNFGMYARRNQWTGHNHLMIPVLHLLDIIRNEWKSYKDSEKMQRAKKFFGGLRYTEQTFGLSWLTRVTYTMPEGGDEPDEEIMRIIENTSGLNVIDLENLGALEKLIEEINEQEIES